MSGNYETRIEVSFKLDESIKEEHYDTINACTNNDCKESEKSLPIKFKFCSSCGSAMSKKKANIRMDIPCHEAFGQKYFNNNFLFSVWNYKNNYWFLNKKINNAEKFTFKANGDDELFLSDIDFKSELEKYKSDPFIQSILAKFDELYGEGSVEIKIGLFPDYN